MAKSSFKNILSILAVCGFFLILVGIVVAHHINIIPSKFWTTDALEIEILGSGFIALSLYFTTTTLTKLSDYKLQQKEILDFFNNIVKLELRNSFKREPSVNTYEGLNSKLFYDNSVINPLYDIIEKYKHDLYKFLRYDPNDELTLKLLDFYNLASDAYILGESMDAYIRAIGKKRKIEDGILYAEMVYLKCVDFACYDDDLICTLLNHSILPSQDFIPKRENIITKYYKGAISNEDSNTLNNYNTMKAHIIDVRNKLLNLSVIINKLLKK